MEMDQIEEFDSTSSSSSASSASESSSNESSGGEEEEGDTCSSFGEAGGEGDVSDSQEDDSSSASEIRRIAMAGGAAGGSGITAASHGGPRSSYRAEKSLKPTEAAGGRRRKRLRKRKATGLRKKLRTHIESVDEFNPEARSAQSAELDRLRRLQLQQSLTAASLSTSQHPHHHSAAPPPQALIVAPPTTHTGEIQPSPPLAALNISSVPMATASQQIYTSPMQQGEASIHVAGPSQIQLSSSAPGVATPTGEGGGVSVASRHSDSSSSPEVLMVDLTFTAKMGEPQRRVEDAIVIDSGSDSDNTAGNNTNEQGHPQAAVAKPQISGGGEVAAVVPTTTQFGSGSGSASVAMPTRSELLNMKYGEILPSPDGRVLVNAGHASSEEDVYLAPQIARTVKPHQIGGIRFLYDNIVESLTRFSSSPGFGCILAHSMGLGKTLQVIGFIEVFFRCTPAKHVLCVVPVNTLQNWIGEFEHWVPPPPSPPSSTSSAAGQSNRSSSSSSSAASGVALLTNQNPLWGQVTSLATKTTPLATMVGSTAGGQRRTNDILYRTFNISILSEANRTMDSRLKVIREWRRVGGVLLLGYEMYRLLSLSVPSLGGNKMAVKKKKNLVVKAPAGGTIDLDETEREMEALIEIQKALCNPGPDLVVCDEGHRIKNDYSNISQALKRIRTRRRIVMTGYPLQNNLTEYWCMVDFVRPNLLGTKQEFADLFERPITNGQCMDSTPMDVRLMRYRSHVLHSLLEGFVLRKGHEILKSTLPPKVEHVLYLRPSQVQADLYDFNMSAIAQAAGNSNSAGPLKAFAVCSKIWNHPDIYYQEAMTQKRSKTISPTTWLDQEGLPKTLLSTGSTSSSAAAKGSSSSESTCRIDWPTSDIPNYQPGVLENSPKMVILAELIDRSVHVGDKILIFSQSLNTLSYIEKMLSQRQIPISNSTDPTGQIQYSSLKWTKNKNYCRLDGSTNSIERDRLINNFNAAGNHDCWVFLLSTKAGCLGINLIGANRVVVTDVSWNPCYDSQAVCRVYRYGQTKPCYIYRLVCDGTMERKIYDRQISKQSMSNRVVDELHPERHLTSQDILKLITPLAQLPPPSDLSAHAMEYFFDPLLMEICSRHGELLTKLPFKHESLLLDSEEERMTEEEKYMAMKGFQQHLKLIRSNPSNQQSGQGGGYRPQPSSLPRPQASQVRPQASQVKAQSGQVRPTQPGSRPFPIPPVPEATPSTSGMMKRGGSMAAAPVISTPSSEKVEVICLDSDEDDNGDDRPVAVIRGEVPIITAANDPISLLQSPTHLQPPSLSSQTTNDPLPASTSAQTPPTSSAHTDSSSALNLNMSFNNSIPPWIDMLMAVTEDAQQRNMLLQAANMYLQETGSYSQPVAMATSPTDDESTMMMGQSSQSVPDVAANVNVFSDVAACATLQSFIQAQGTNTCEQMNNGEVTAASSNSVVGPLSSPPPLTSPVSPPPIIFQQQTQVYGNATPLSSLPQASNAIMSSTPIMTSSSLSNGIGPLCSQSQMSQVQVKLEHSSNSLSPPPSNNTFHANKSPSVSPVAQSSPSRYTSSPSSASSSSLSPPSPSPRHQTPQSPINKTPESSSNTCATLSLPPSSVSLLTCGSNSCSSQSTDSLKLKRSKSHSAPVRHLATASPLRKTQSSSPPKSYSLSQKFHSSLLLNDDSLTTVIGARSTSVSPTSTLSPSQSNSSDCSSPPPEQPSKPQNHQSESPPTRLDSSVTFRYSSSPSPSNTPSAPYTPCSIPLLSPVAARLLYLSTGTKLPSSPPEDVDKLPPIINRKPVKKEGHGCATSLASVLKKESGSSARSSSPSSAEKKHHHSDKKKRKGSSLAKSMELVPMSTDITPESFFTSNQMTSSSSVTTPTSAPLPPQVMAASSCVTTPSPVDPPAMQCSSLPLRRNSYNSFKNGSSTCTSTKSGALASPTAAATTVANLWALKSQPQLTNSRPVTASHVSSTEQLLSNIFKMTSSSKSLSAVNSLSTVVSRSLATAQVSTLSTMLSAAAAQNSNFSTVLTVPPSSTGLVSASNAVQPTTVVAVAPLTSAPAKSPVLSLSACGAAFSTSASISPKVPATTPTITHGPTLSTMVGRNQGSALTTAAVNKALNLSPSCLPQSKTTATVSKNPSMSSPYLSHSHSKTTLPTWSSTSQQCSPTTYSISSTPAAAGGIALSSLPLPPPSQAAAAASSLAQKNVSQRSSISHNGLTSPILSAVLNGTSTSVPSAFTLSNAARLPQTSQTAQQLTSAQHVGSNGGGGIISPTTLSSAYSSGVPAAPMSGSSLGTSGVKLGHAQNHLPATAVSMTTAMGGAIMSPSNNTIMSSIQNSAESAQQYTSSCSALTTTSTLTSSPSSSTAVVGEMSVVDELTTMEVNLPPLPEGLEHRVVSGLLQAGPPVALNKLHDSVQKPRVKNEAAAAFATSGGYGVVTSGGVAHTIASSASCGPTHQPRMRNSSSSSSCDSNPPLLSPVLVNSSKLPNTSPPYTKNHTVTSGQKLVATKPSPPSQPPMVSSAAHSVEVPRSSILTMPSTQAQTTCSSVLPSPTVAISTNQLPSLNSTSRRNSSSLEMPMGDNGASQGNNNNVTAVNMNDFLTSECATGTLILSPTQLLSPSSLLSPPAGSTTLPDPLKTFIFPISLSPPIERRQPSTSESLAQNGFSALQSSSTRQEQHQNEQKQRLPVRGSLRSPDHRHGNSPVLPIHRQQSQGPLLSPTLQRNNADIQRNNTFVQKRSSPAVAQDVRKESFPSLSPTQHKSSPVAALPNSQRNNSFMQQRNSAVLGPSPHNKNGPSLSGNQQNGPSFSENQQRSRPNNLASNQQGSTQLLSPTKLEQRSGPALLAPDQQKCGASSIPGTGGQRPRMLSSSNAMTTVHNGSLQGRSIAPKPQQKVVSPVVVPTVQRNGWDVMQSLLLSPPPAPDDCRRNISAPSQSDQQRGSTVIVPSSNSQRNGTILPSFDKKTHGNNSVVSPGSQTSHLLAPSSVGQKGSPAVSSSQQRNSTMIPPPPRVDCGGVPPADSNKNGALFSPPYSMPLPAQQRSTNVTSQARAPSASLNSYSMINGGSGLLADNALSLTAHVSQSMTSCSQHHQRRSGAAVLPPPSQMTTSSAPPPPPPPPPPVNNSNSNALLSPTVLTSPVPFSNHQAGSGMLLSSPNNSQMSMSIHRTSSSDGAHYLLSSPISQGSGSVPPAACSQQKGGAAARRKSISFDQPRSGAKVSPELQKSGPSLSRKSQQMSPVVVPSTQKKTGGGKSSTDKKKSKNRKLSSSSHQRNTAQSSTNQHSYNNSQPTTASNITQRSNTPLLPSLNLQRNGSPVPLSHQRSSPILSSSSSPFDLQRSNTASLTYSHQNGTCTVPVSHLPNCQRNGAVTVARQGNGPLVSPDCLKHSTVPSSSNQHGSAAGTLPTVPQTTSTAPPPVFSRDAQKSSAFPSANTQSTSVAAVSWSTSQTNGAILTPSFSSGGGLNSALPSSNHQMSSPTSSIHSALSSYQMATASSLHMATPAAMGNTLQKSSATNPKYTSLSMANSGGNGLAASPHSVSVTISNRLPPPPHTNSPTPGAINSVLTCTSPSPVQSTPPSFVNRPAMAAATGSTRALHGLNSAVCHGGSASSYTPATVSGGFASTPQINGVTNSNGLVSSTPHLTNIPSLGTPLHQQPHTLKASPSQQEETGLPQNGSMSSVSPSWDAATLSLLSDLFSPQPPQGQKFSENSQPKQLQAQATSVALPSMDGDQLINEFLTNSQSQNSMSSHPQASASFPNVASNDDASSIISDLLASSQNQNLVPKCPQTSVNQQGMGGGGQVMKDLLSSSRNPSPSQNASKKRSAVLRPQSLLNGQRSNSSATHPLMQVSSPTVNGRLPQQQKNSPLLPNQQQNQSGPSLVQRQEKGPQNIHSWQQQSNSLQTQQHCQQRNGLLSQQQQNGSLSQYQQKCPLPQQNGPLSQLQLQQNGSSLQLQQIDQLSQSHQNGPISQKQLNGTFSQPQQNGSLSQHQLNTSLPRQQLQQNGPLSRDGMMLWEQNDLLSSSSNLPPPCPQSHQAAAVSTPHTNNSSGGPMQLISSSNNVLQSPQLGGIQISPASLSSTSYSPETRGQLQQLLSPPPSQAGGLPSLPKLTPLPSQPPMVGSNQAPFTVSTPPFNQVSAGTASSQQQLGRQLGGCATAPPTDDLMSKSVPLPVGTAPQQSSMESTLNTQNSNSINLLSILNSLTPSQLESLLDSATKDGQPSPMSLGNGHQENKHSSIGNCPSAVPHSQNTLTNFPNQNFGSSSPPNLPPRRPTPAASYRESHNAAKPKVAVSTGVPQFTVRSSCTSTELRGQLLQLEPTAAVMHGAAGGYNSNATAGSVSALRLHSHQIN